jgi:hypothetical protein
VRELSNLQTEVLRLQSENKVLKECGTEDMQIKNLQETTTKSETEAASIPPSLSLKSSKGRLKKRRAETVLKALHTLDFASEEVEVEAFFKGNGTTGADCQDEMMGEAEHSDSLLRRSEAFLQSNTFEKLITVLLCGNVLFVAFEMQHHGLITGFKLSFYDKPLLSEGAGLVVDQFFVVGNMVFTVLFFIDVSLRICILRMRFWCFGMNWVDLFSCRHFRRRAIQS